MGTGGTMELPFDRMTLVKLFIALCGMAFLCQCNEAHDDYSYSDSSILPAEFAVQNWPNDTTTLKGSSIISSKILVSDLNKDGTLENVFISHVLNSTDTLSSVVRITSGAQFKEVANFTSQKAYILKDCVPFAFDINNDGLKEMFFVSADRGKVYAIQFVNKDLKKLFVRWKLDLPGELPENFERQIKIINHNGKKAFRVGKFTIYEKTPRVPSVQTGN